MQSETKWDQEQKLIWINLKGFTTLEVTQAAVDEFEQSLDTFPVEEHTLVIDCHEMEIFDPEILPVLSHCYTLYNKFKKCVMVLPQKMVVSLQLKRIGKSANFEGVFVKTVEEAKSLI